MDAAVVLHLCEPMSLCQKAISVQPIKSSNKQNIPKIKHETNDCNESIWQFHLNPTEGTVYILASNVKRLYFFNKHANTQPQTQKAPVFQVNC